MEGYNSMLDGYVYYFDNIYLDLEREEVITYEFILQEEVNKLKNKN